MQIKIFASFSEYKIIDQYEWSNTNVFILNVGDEMAARWVRVMSEYHHAQREMKERVLAFEENKRLVEKYRASNPEPKTED